MLIAKGYRVALRRPRSAKLRKLPASYALLHDVKGADWPSCSALIAPFTRSRQQIPGNVDVSPAVEYFNYEPRGGHLVLPSKRLSDWKDLGEVNAITYIRPGDKEGLGDDLLYGHEFSNETGWWIFKSETGYPRLYKHGRAYRMELPNGCVWNWRGFCYP